LNRTLWLETNLRVPENEKVDLIVSLEELQVQLNRLLARQNGPQLVVNFLRVLEKKM
jgi:hypothetical protein